MPMQIPTSVLVLDGLINQNQLTSAVVSQTTAAMVEYLSSTETKENGWAFNLNIGTYGTNYLLRAAVAKFGFGANIAADAVYMHTATDITGSSLNGTNGYVIHFAPGQTPPERGFWSITPYDNNSTVLSASSGEPRKLDSKISLNRDCRSYFRGSRGRT